MKRKKALIDIAAGLRDKYGKEPKIFYGEEKVMLEKANRHNAPVIPEEVDEIINNMSENIN